MRGSARNQVSWRRANCRVATMVSSAACAGVGFAVEDLEELGVAEGPRGGPAEPEPGGVELPDLVEQPAVHHGVDPAGEPFPELFPVHLEPDLHGGLEVLAGGHEGAERPPGQFEHLQRADDPARVPEPAGRDRVHGFQPRPQRRRSGGFQFRFEPAPDGRVGAREFQHVQGGADVEPGAAGQDGAFAAGVDVRR